MMVIYYNVHILMEGACIGHIVYGRGCFVLIIVDIPIYL